MPRRLMSWRLVLGGGLLAGFLGLWGVPAPTGAEELSREQQIADLERQIQELTRRLEELRKAPAPTTKTQEQGLPAEWVKALHWRCIGPAAMGGRITAFAVCETDPTTYWVATASGGLLRTVNNGVTFEHQFDRENTVSIGDVCVAPSDRNIVWVGTGENNPRNSVSPGDGVYKSTDGGKSWQHMGLKKSCHVGRIAIHPTNPNIVYVGVLGRLYGPSEERGLFKTTDGGKTWHRALFVDDKTGVIDVRMNPADPETLLVATWEVRRDAFDSFLGEPVPEGHDPYDPVVKWGPGSGIWKTTDGGKTFNKLTKGLPTVAMGRIGLDYYRKDPKVVFAIIDTEKVGVGPPPPAVYLGIQGEDAPGGGAKLTAVAPEGPANRAGLKVGDVLKAADKKEIKNYGGLVEMLRGSKIDQKVPLAVQRDKETKEITVTLAKRPEGPGGGGRRGPSIGIRVESTPGGVRVLEVLPQSPAEKASVQKGDVIEAVGRQKVTSQRELFEALRGHNPGDKVTLKVLRGKESKELSVVLGPPAGGRGASAERPYSGGLGGQRENVQDQQGPDGFQTGGVYKSTDGGETWVRINSVNPRPFYFSQVRVDPSDDKYVCVLGIALYRSEDGGKTFKAQDIAVHPDQHALWIDPRDGRHMLVGCDGGFYVTYDRMARWDYLNTMAIGQFYHVSLDTRQPYRAYGGLQDNGSWGGPSHTLDGQGPLNDDWYMVSGGDGFVCRVDANDPDLVYFESQDGHMGRRNLRTGERASFRPHDVPGQPPYRFNWNTPFILSAHNSRIFYCGGNYLFRSLHEGDELRPISREITRTKRGSATALAESPRNANVLWAGTDDGALWVTRDGGTNWDNVADRVGLPGPRWVSSIEASRFVEGRAYVAFDGHRSDDDDPHVYVTEDFGKSWKSLRSNLPAGPTRVLREDIENADLLYLGTEFAVWASLDRGGTWTKINNDLPTVAVHELALHPTAGEMVAATHGRSLWVLDVTALRQMKPTMIQESAHLYRPATTMRWRSEPMRGTPYGAGNHRFIGENPPSGAQLCYSLGKKAGKVQLRVVDYANRTVRELPGKTEPGLHRVTWDLVQAPPAVVSPWRATVPVAGAGPLAAPGRPAGGPPRRGPGRGQSVAPPGMYRVILVVDGQELTQPLRVELDPALRTPPIMAEEEDADEAEEREEKRPGRIDD
jgi:photosystem II stability/assembly factor-like uncharacterized protein